MVMMVNKKACENFSEKSEREVANTKSNSSCTCHTSTDDIVFESL